MKDNKSLIGFDEQSILALKPRNITLDKVAFQFLLEGKENGRTYTEMVDSINAMGYRKASGSALTDTDISAFMIKNGIRQIKFRGKKQRILSASPVRKTVANILPKPSAYQQTLHNMQQILSMNVDDKTRVRLITALLLPEA